MNETDLKLKPMEIMDILDNCFRLYRAHFFKFILIAAIPQVLVFITTGIWHYFIFLTPKPAEHVARTIAMFLPTVPLLILSWFLQFIATGALAYAVSKSYLGHEIEVKASYIYVLKRIWPLIGALILTGLATGAGFLLCIIPGIIFTMWFIFTTQSVVIENCAVMESISRSRKLAIGNMGKIFIIGILFLVIAMVIGGVLQFPFIVMGALRARPGMPQAFGIQIMQTAGQTIGNILVNPIFMISFTLIYYDIRIRKEGFDLQVMAENLGRK